MRMPTKASCQSCHSHSQAPTLSGRDAETFINRACGILRSIYGVTPDNHPDPRLCSDPPPPLTKHLQGLYFPEPLATRQPTVSWYIANLSFYSRASAGVFHTALAYLERAKPRFKPVPADPRTAFVAALVLAHRFLEDGSYRTETWARLSGSSSRMISACIEAMFDALEHRLWIGPVPDPDNNKMFSMREGTIFSEEMMGGQRRCSLPSLSAIYGAASSSKNGRIVRAFGDPQDVPVAPAPLPVAGPSNPQSSPPALVSKPAQGLPSPPASPGLPNTPPSAARPLVRARTAPAPKTVPRVRHATGAFDFAQWRAAPGAQSRSQTEPVPTPPTLHSSIQPSYPPMQYARRPSHPPPMHVSYPIRAHDSPVFNAIQWCAPIPELAEDVSMSEATSTSGDREMETTPPRTPPDTDTFDPLSWAKGPLFPPQPAAALVTPAPTVKIESPEKAKGGMRYPSATLVPPSSCLDPAWSGRRHSIAVTGTRY